MAQDQAHNLCDYVMQKKVITSSDTVIELWPMNRKLMRKWELKICESSKLFKTFRG